MARQHHPDHRRPGPPRRAHHASPPGSYPRRKWVVCMFSPGDAHIPICDPKRLPGPEATIRMADCERVIVKGLQDADHHALLLQARFLERARAAKTRGVARGGALPSPTLSSS